jgi:phosphotransferase system IIB component
MRKNSLIIVESRCLRIQVKKVGNTNKARLEKLHHTYMMSSVGKYNLQDISGIPAEEIKTQIKRIKKELKLWEQEFAQVHGRKPEKKDIAQVQEIGI